MIVQNRRTLQDLLNEIDYVEDVFILFSYFCLLLSLIRLRIQKNNNILNHSPKRR